MEDSLYATYLGTFLTLATAIRRSDRLLARQIIADALCVDGDERFAILVALDDASTGRRRRKHELLGAVRARSRSAAIEVAA